MEMIYTALHIGYRMMPFVETESRLNPALRLNGGIVTMLGLLAGL